MIRKGNLLPQCARITEPNQVDVAGKRTTPYLSLIIISIRRWWHWALVGAIASRLLSFGATLQLPNAPRFTYPTRLYPSLQSYTQISLLSFPSNLTPAIVCLCITTWPVRFLPLGLFHLDNPGSTRIRETSTIISAQTCVRSFSSQPCWLLLLPS
jgi:hypothetical protein